MKTCSICKQEKSETEFFHSSYTRLDGTRNLRPDCKVCCNKVKQASKRKNKAAYSKGTRDRKKAIKDYILQIKSNPCSDCGKSYPYYVMDFDHLADKLHTINWLSNREFSLTRVQKEIDKCELVCANCHKERTYQRNPQTSYLRPSKRLVIQAKSNPCVVCEKQYPYWVMELHHLENKDGELSYMIRNGATTTEVEQEIKKCVPICTNCHREITWNKNGERSV